jgi:hypothetical protein
MRSEAYPEMASVLQRFVAGVENALGSNFLGVYLVGSLATGVRSLQHTRVDIHALGCYPASSHDSGSATGINNNSTNPGGPKAPSVFFANPES